MAYGPRDTSDLVLHPGWDADALKKFELADGTTFEAVKQQLNVALNALNAELNAHPVFSSLVSYTDQPTVEYGQDGGNGFEDFTEYARAASQRGSTIGHMLPLRKKDRALGWTWSYLKDARLPQIQQDIRDAMNDARSLWRVAILTRALQRGDDTGASKGLGATGISPGFATAAANTGVDFIPPTVNGNEFTSDHEHYVAAAGGWSTTIFEDMRDELREHGHEPPFELLVAKADQPTIEGLTGFTPTAETLKRYGQDTTLATLDNTSIAGSYYFGTLKDFGIRVMPGMPQHYGLPYKSAGPNSQMNPMRIRLERGLTRPRIVAMPDPRSGAGAAYPLQYIMLYIELGVGVFDRTAASPRYVNNATWADGTPS